jgi:hypothetical protein
LQSGNNRACATVAGRQADRRRLPRSCSVLGDVKPRAVPAVLVLHEA